VWLTLDDSHLTESEHSVATSLRDVLLDTCAATLQVTNMDDHGQPQTTIVVIQRPTEVVLLVIRPDRSVVVATDDIQAMRWSDAP
jgi:hypothetical protein